ncbi:hypothetical protein DPMN_128381 [Dreissena polymorpha]|uniref:Uncharacterized protein n=1 Tax=Dreissena polymorpha TaxID=45954 RepID=A0A9D4JVP3_DREPO|nr:hypothetical protein DPMN_128381 [Dreissena polymorpha]
MQIKVIIVSDSSGSPSQTLNCKGHMVFMLHPQDKSLSVEAASILSYRWIMRGKRNWQLWLNGKMERESHCLYATTPAFTRSLSDYQGTIKS